MLNKFYFRATLFVLLLISIHLLILIKIQFIAWPEMLSYPYLLQKGYLLYKDIINPYPPVLPYLLLFYFNLFGLNLFSLKLITLLVITIIDLLIVLVVRKIFNTKLALLSLVIFVFFQPALEGNGLWFDLLITPFLLLVYYLGNLIFNKKKEKSLAIYILFLGLVLGFAFLVKQTVGFIFLSFLLFIFFLLKGLFKKVVFLSLYILSFLIPILFISYFMYNLGLLGDYLFWVYLYPFQHIQNTGFPLYPTVKQLLVLSFLTIPIVYSLVKFKSESKLLPLFAVFGPSLLFIVPRFSYFHIQPVLPFVTILTAYFLSRLLKRNRLTFAVLYLLGILIICSYFFAKNFDKEPRFYDKETIRIAFLLKERLPGLEPIFFYNVSSEYFVISGLLPSKPWVDTFPWYLGVNGLQQRITQNLNSQQVNYVVFKKFASEGNNIPGSYKPKTIDSYIQSNYIDFEGVSNTIRILKRKID